MNYKKYIFVICLTSFMIVLLISVINYFMNIYGVFNRDFSKPPTRSLNNMRFVKTEYILNNINKYDSFIFGSSRVGRINVNNIPNGENYYNMSYIIGMPKDHLKIINLMLINGVNIKNLLIGIDDFSIGYDADDDNRLKGLSCLHYPTEQKIGFYAKFLFDIPSYAILKQHLFGNNTPPDNIIESNPVKHINDAKFKTPSRNFSEYRVDAVLKELKEIKDIAKKNNINLIFFINPIHHVTYLNNDLEKINEFKQKLAIISSYYDFSGLNSITTNNYYYYEPSHYRPIVGNMIIARIFGIEGIAPDDFGILIPKQN